MTMSKPYDALHGIEQAINLSGLSKNMIREIAAEELFFLRNSSKYEPEQLVYLFALLLVSDTASYNDLAAAMHTYYNIDITRQALALRLNTDAAVCFVRRLLKTAMQLRMSFKKPRHHACWRRILVQDSTVVQLPIRLLEAFSGVHNAHCPACNARIQLIIEVLSGTFLRFSVDPYSRNDLKAEVDLQVLPGDLVLRDRGYLSAAIIARLIDGGAAFICRYKHKVKFYWPDTGKEFKVAEELRHFQRLDVDLLLRIGTDGPTVRFIGRQVDQQLADLRRCQLYKQTKGHKPSAELLELCNWTIFLSNLFESKYTFEDHLELYGLRWRVECVFKTWKSHLKFNRFHCASERQAHIIFTIRLLMICVIHHSLWLPLSEHVSNASDRLLSLLKFTRYITVNLNRIGELMKQLVTNTIKTSPLIRYCAYDQRQRANYEATLLNLCQHSIMGAQMP